MLRTGDGDRRHGHLRTLAERLGDVGLRLFAHAPWLMASGAAVSAQIHPPSPGVSAAVQLTRASCFVASPRRPLAREQIAEQLIEVPMESHRPRALQGVRGRPTDRRSNDCPQRFFETAPKPAAMPHHNSSLRPGGIQGAMNLGRGVRATHRQRGATVLLAWGSSTLTRWWSAGRPLLRSRESGRDR
jgi:hypothetical protein